MKSSPVGPNRRSTVRKTVFLAIKWGRLKRPLISGRNTFLSPKCSHGLPRYWASCKVFLHFGMSYVHPYYEEFFIACKTAYNIAVPLFWLPYTSENNNDQYDIYHCVYKLARFKFIRTRFSLHTLWMNNIPWVYSNTYITNNINTIDNTPMYGCYVNWLFVCLHTWIIVSVIDGWMCCLYVNLILNQLYNLSYSILIICQWHRNQKCEIIGFISMGHGLCDYWSTISVSHFRQKILGFRAYSCKDHHKRPQPLSRAYAADSVEQLVFGGKRQAAIRMICLHKCINDLVSISMYYMQRNTRA